MAPDYRLGYGVPRRSPQNKFLSGQWIFQGQLECYSPVALPPIVPPKRRPPKAPPIGDIPRARGAQHDAKASGVESCSPPSRSQAPAPAIKLPRVAVATRGNINSASDVTKQEPSKIVAGLSDAEGVQSGKAAETNAIRPGRVGVAKPQPSGKKVVKAKTEKDSPCQPKESPKRSPKHDKDSPGRTKDPKRSPTSTKLGSASGGGKDQNTKLSDESNNEESNNGGLLGGEVKHDEENLDLCSRTPQHVKKPSQGASEKRVLDASEERALTLDIKVAKLESSTELPWGKEREVVDDELAEDPPEVIDEGIEESVDAVEIIAAVTSHIADGCTAAAPAQKHTECSPVLVPDASPNDELESSLKADDLECSFKDAAAEEESIVDDSFCSESHADGAQEDANDFIDESEDAVEVIAASPIVPIFEEIVAPGREEADVEERLQRPDSVESAVYDCESLHGELNEQGAAEDVNEVIEVMDEDGDTKPLVTTDRCLEHRADSALEEPPETIDQIVDEMEEAAESPIGAKTRRTVLENSRFKVEVIDAGEVSEKEDVEDVEARDSGIDELVLDCAPAEFVESMDEVENGVDYMAESIGEVDRGAGPCIASPVDEQVAAPADVGSPVRGECIQTGAPGQTESHDSLSDHRALDNPPGKQMTNSDAQELDRLDTSNSGDGPCLWRSNGAAAKIQAHARGRDTRKALDSKCKAAKKLQLAVRRWQACRNVSKGACMSTVIQVDKSKESGPQESVDLEDLLDELEVDKGKESGPRESVDLEDLLDELEAATSNTNEKVDDQGHDTAAPAADVQDDEEYECESFEDEEASHGEADFAEESEEVASAESESEIRR